MRTSKSCLPDVDAYLPTEDGDPPLARAEQWNINRGDRMEYNTMPGWAGSSWYFLRYMDPHNADAFCDRAKSDYWGQVDLLSAGQSTARATCFTAASGRSSSSTSTSSDSTSPSPK